MLFKTWFRDKVNAIDRLLARNDLPVRPLPEGASCGGVWIGGAKAPENEMLGPYAPLIEAIRDELERFTTTRMRLHLAIAEHDRYQLAAIEVRCLEAGEAPLVSFVREFRPEQIGRFLTREVIARLPHARAIDVSQFAGLRAVEAPAHEAVGTAADAGHDYGELLAELNRSSPAVGRFAYKVTLIGRWLPAGVGSEPTLAAACSSVGHVPASERRIDIDIEDGRGHRTVSLPALPGRRYAIGKGEDCDVRVDGTYVSGRHCELWFDDGHWWVKDANSTNGIRVETALGTSACPPGRLPADAGSSVLALAPDARLVLSAFACGGPADCPCLHLRTSDRQSAGTPIAAAAAPAAGANALPRGASALMLTVRMASGIRSFEFGVDRLPLGVGRSRGQAVVIDGAHAGVSGHHVDILDFDRGGAEVLVHGDNGVIVAGSAHTTGARFRWQFGEIMVLGRAAPHEPACALTLSRRR